MKSTQQIINQVVKKIQKKQKNQSSQPYDTNNSLTAFDLIPIHFTGIIEDYLFRQSKQIFDILKQQTDHDIEGLTYDQIKNDLDKNIYYHKVKANIPKYYPLKGAERQKHFKIEGQLYLQKLGIKQNQQDLQNKPQTPKKKQNSLRQPTPIKVKISKKQSLINKKQQKKINAKDQKNNGQKDKLQKLDSNQVKQQGFSTPQKKKKQKKKVKFFQFQYVKDFSQYKTPKRLALAQQIIQPLKEIQQQGPKEE